MDEFNKQYLTWLYARIGSTQETRKTRTFWSLCHQLYSRNFVWLIANDDNRVEDGRELRYEFLDSVHISSRDPNWLEQGCSVLEMLIGVSERLSFLDDRTALSWFWELLNNLGLNGCTDSNYDSAYVDDILTTLVFRQYEPNGQGGLFPMHNPRQDQRKVEIWYQLNQYILEQR